MKVSGQFHAPDKEPQIPVGWQYGLIQEKISYPGPGRFPVK
jgi:hypothetical protein